jgi:hypothetical protein
LAEAARQQAEAEMAAEIERGLADAAAKEEEDRRAQVVREQAEASMRAIEEAMEAKEPVA